MMMPFYTSRKFLLLAIAVVLILIGVTVWQFIPEDKELPAPIEPVVNEEKPPAVSREVIGQSVEGREIESFTYGSGDTKLLFVGGIHGGYEWNSVFLAYRVMDYLESNPNVVSDKLSVTIIPSLNPDGVYKVVGKPGRFTVDDVPDAISPSGAGRFNANAVDLNRNFDCKWKPEATWRGNAVSAGTAAFSEPEARALRDFVMKQKPAAVIFWHSQANAVYASECLEGVLPDTLALMNTYATAGQYPAVESFDAYPVSGDAEGWLASINIPAITVELSSHDIIEWDKNLPALNAVLEHYSNYGK